MPQHWYDYEFDPSDADRTFVVFIDSLGPDDLDKMAFAGEQFYRGRMDAGVPKVTPAVLSQIYTGVDPANNGLPAVSRYDTEERHRPVQYTLPEIAAMSDEYDRVLNFGLPFCTVPPRLQPDDDYWTISQGMGEQQAGPAEAQNHLFCPGPAGDLRTDDPAIVFNAMHDHTRQIFEQARTLAEANDFDLVFISHRLLDSYTHWRRTLEHPHEGIEFYRDALIREIDEQIYETAKHGDVFLFGDHGSKPLERTFRINRWLIEHDYLDVIVDWDWIDSAEEYGIVAGEEHPADEEVPNQISWEQPGVEVTDETIAICADPFSTGITLNDPIADPATVEELRSDLMDTGYFEEVHYTDDLWDADGAYRDECPDLYPERKPGVYVTGNIHPWPIGVGYMRSGVHGQYGAWASSRPLSEWENETLTPLDVHECIKGGFLGIEEYVPLADELDDLTTREKEQVLDHLSGSGGAERPHAPAEAGGGE